MCFFPYIFYDKNNNSLNVLYSKYNQHIIYFIIKKMPNQWSNKNQDWIKDN